jgi:large subunit ribosomal protein L4
MPRKARQLAVKSALSEKLRANELIVIDAIDFEAPKTKNVVKMLADLHSEGKALIVDGARNTVLSARNIPGVKAYAPSGLNIYDIVNTDKLFLTQEAVKKIEEVLA